MTERIDHAGIPGGSLMKRRRRCWLHNWQVGGFVGVLSMLETCSKCGKRRVFNGCTGDYIYYPPIKEGFER